MLFHQEPLQPSCKVYCLTAPYVDFCRASTVLQDAAMQRITCRRQASAYCTYGLLLSVAMEKHADGLRLKRLISSSRRPSGWRLLMTVGTTPPHKRSHAWIREQWCSQSRYCWGRFQRNRPYLTSTRAIFQTRSKSHVTGRARLLVGRGSRRAVSYPAVSARREPHPTTRACHRQTAFDGLRIRVLRSNSLSGA
jgi:hypothetical protein